MGDRREYMKSYHQKHRSAHLANMRANNSRSHKQRIALRQQNREWVAGLKAKPCQDCGGLFPSVCMDYDHRDPSTKFKTVSWLLRYSRKTILTEIAKCDLVCANCHRIRHEKRGWNNGAS